MTAGGEGERRTAAVAEALRVVRGRIAAVERTWTHEVRVVGVTKGHGPWAIEAATDVGLDAIGENYAQEVVAKRSVIEQRRPQVQFIGQLQSNKVRQLVGLVDLWASLDRPSVVAEVAKRAPGARVLIQVDTTGEPGKGGCRVADAAGLVEGARRHGLDVAGLLTVGPTDGSPETARPGFALVRSLVDEFGLQVCSMGMSADLEIAVEEGATEVRIGSLLFGPRSATR